MKTLRNTYLLILATLLIIQPVMANNANENLISSTVIGKGQPIILVHGMACTSDVWEEVVERYQKDYEMHLIHIKGFGNPEKGDYPQYLEQIKNELISYSKNRNLENPILMGHSMGGFLGLWAAAEEPALFSKIVSVDGVPYFPVLQMPGITPEMAKSMASQMTASMGSWSGEEAKANQEMMIASMIKTEEKRPKVVDMGIRSNPEVIPKVYGEMFTTDIRPLMKNVEVPVLVFGSWAAYQAYGATKSSVEAGYQDQLKDIKNHKLLVADEAYHFVFYDEPDWFFEELEAFLGK